MPDLPEDLRAYLEHLACPQCGTQSGRGLSVTVTVEGPGSGFVSAGCLRCGLTGWFRVISRIPREPAPAPFGSEITTDEVLDLHEALKAADWLTQLTAKK